MGKINQVVVNGQNYEVEDKVARNYYPDTKQSAAIAEENSYKIVDKNGNIIAEFKSDLDISILLGGDEENAVVKITKNKVEILQKDIIESIKSCIIKDSNNNVINQNASNDIDSNSRNNTIIGRGNNIKYLKNSVAIGNFINTDIGDANENVILGIRPLLHDRTCQLAIGCPEGEGDTKKSNIIYHKYNNTYFKGLGEYNGTNDYNDCKSLQQIISDFETRIAALEKMTKVGH